jgi:hypothetical protein
MVPHVVEGPSRVDGAIARVVSDGALDWVEVWSGTAWRREDYGVTIRDVMVAPPAETVCAVLGIALSA